VKLAYLSLGSNVGDRGAYLASGVTSVCGTDPARVSPVYETAPIGGVVQANFWNLVVELSTDASARDLLGRAQAAETAASRSRDVRWGPRTLDVDVLLVGDDRCCDDDLVVPHPRMWTRRFVLAPLRDLAPQLVNDDAWTAAHGDVTKLGTLESLR
jgi:2-amino-4-hydroxy-6-hydroxymethyldihydropteridine diphosphokinase